MLLSSIFAKSYKALLHSSIFFHFLLHYKHSNNTGQLSKIEYMATATGETRCVICNKENSTVTCEGCLQIFCYDHLTNHRQELGDQLIEIENNRDSFRQTLNEQINDPQKY